MTTRTLAEILTLPVAATGPDGPVSHALTLMQEPGVSAVVITRDDRPLGIFTERDLVRFTGHRNNPDAISISEVMTKPLITASPDTDFQEAVSLIEQHGIRHLVVIDHAGRLAGMVTEGDLLPYLHRAIDELRDSESRLAEAQQLARIGTWELDLVDDKLWWSDEVYRIFEVEPPAFGASYLAFLSVVHPEDREMVNLAYTQSVELRRGYDILHRLAFPDGRIKHVNERGRTLYAADGTPLRSIGTIQDITERKRAEQALVENEARLKSIFRAAPVGIGVVVNRVLTEVNDHFCEMTGYSREELVGRSSRILYPSDDDFAYVGREKYRQIREAGSGRVETRLRHKDGAILHVILSSTPLDPDDPSKGVTFTVLDISQRRRVEEELRMTLTERDTITATVPDLMYMFDRLGKMRWWNKSVETVAGWTPEQIAATPAIELVVAEDRPSVLKAIERAFNQGFAEVQARYRTKEGPRDYLFNGRRIEYGNDSLLVGSGRDLSERLEAEQAIRSSEEKYRNLFESAQEGIWLVDVDANTQLANPRLAEMLGYRANEMQGRSLFEFVAPDQRALAEERFAHHQAGTRVQHELRFQRADGSDLWAIVAATPVLDNSGNFKGGLALIMDITERKRMEAALHTSEARLRTLVNTLPDLVWLKDPDGVYLLCNSRFECFFGASEKEIVGKNDFDFVDAELARFFRQKDNEAIAAGGPRINEEWVTYADDGHRELLETIKTPMHDSESQLVGVLGIARSITERHEAQKRIEQALDLAERRQSYLQAILNNMPFLAWLKDEKGRFLAVNQAFAQSCGAPNADWLVSKTDLDVWPERQAEANRADDREVMETGQRKVVEETFVAEDIAGWLETSKTPIFDSEGKIIGTTGFAQDVTERIKARDELERHVAARTAELQAANAELEAFTYAVSHDLRAPLRAISGFSQALIEDLGDGLDDRSTVYLNQLIDAGRHMSDLVEGLLRLSRSTMREPVREQVDLSALVRLTAERLKERYPNPPVRLDIQTGVTTTADRKLLVTVVENLMDNAWKYTANTPMPRIEFFTEQQGQNSIYCLRDNGAGFDMEFADNLFAPFQRLHRQDEFPGIGIGLATVQRIIKRHGGEIWATSEPRKGARFCFTLER